MSRPFGYLHGEFEASSRLARSLERIPFRQIKLEGILSKVQILHKVWLSPEMEKSDEDDAAGSADDESGYEVLNLVFHSTAIMKGCSPFIRTAADEQLFLENLRRFLGLVKDEGVVCASLSEAARLPSTCSASMCASPSVLSTHGAGSA